MSQLFLFFPFKKNISKEKKKKEISPPPVPVTSQVYQKLFWEGPKVTND